MSEQELSADLSVAELLRQGKAAVRANDYPTARRLLSQVVQRDPRNEQAWLWLSGTLEDSERMRYCLQRVLQLNPHNQAAAAALEDLDAGALSMPSALPASADQAAPRHLSHRRPASMIEGEAVSELVQGHTRIAWSYIGIWAVIVGLHLMLLRSRAPGPRISGGQIWFGALLLAGVQLLPWMLLIGMLKRAISQHSLGRTSLHAAISAAIWPSALTALAGLALGALVGSANPAAGATSDLVQAGLGAASLLLLLRGLLVELTGSHLYDRAARRQIGVAFAGFIAAWLLCTIVAWNMVR